jgi:hypothetical protein
LINVNESAGKGAGHGPPRREIILSEKVRSALQAHAAPQMGGRMRSAEIIFVTAD